MKVLVYGGTGSQAGPTVAHLLKRGHLPYVLTRNNDKVAELHEAGAKAVVADMRDLDHKGSQNPMAMTAKLWTVSGLRCRGFR